MDEQKFEPIPYAVRLEIIQRVHACATLFVEPFALETVLAPAKTSDLLIMDLGDYWDWIDVNRCHQALVREAVELQRARVVFSPRPFPQQFDEETEKSLMPHGPRLHIVARHKALGYLRELAIANGSPGNLLVTHEFSNSDFFNVRNVLMMLKGRGATIDQRLSVVVPAWMYPLAKKMINAMADVYGKELDLVGIPISLMPIQDLTSLMVQELRIILNHPGL